MTRQGNWTKRSINLEADALTNTQQDCQLKKRTWGTVDSLKHKFAFGVKINCPKVATNLLILLNTQIYLNTQYIEHVIYSPKNINGSW